MSYEIRDGHRIRVPSTFEEADRICQELVDASVKRSEGKSEFSPRPGEISIYLPVKATRAKLNKADAAYELLYEECPEWSRIQERLKRADELEAELEEKQPKTKDGKFIFLGDEVWFHDPDRSIFEPEGIVCEEVSSIYNGKGYKEYEGNFTICCDTYEAGNLEFYSSREECQKEVQEEQDRLIEGAEQEANNPVVKESFTTRKEGESSEAN